MILRMSLGNLLVVFGMATVISSSVADSASQPDEATEYILRPDDKLSSRLVKELGKDYLSNDEVKAYLFAGNGVAWIMLRPLGEGPNTARGDGLGELRVTQSATVFDREQAVYRTIGTIDIRGTSKTVSVDFQLTAQVSVSPAVNQKVPFTASTIWGEVRVVNTK